jgi:hypothetical protein
MRSLRPILISGAVLFAAACAPDSTPTGVTSPGSPSFDRAPDAGSDQATANRHVFELRNSPGNAAAHAGGKGGGSGTGISYHGGSVLLNATNVVAVYWASAPIYTNGPAVGSTGTGSADGSLIGYFLRNLGGSPYFNINTTYTNGTTKIANVVNYNGFWANNTNAPSGNQTVSDAQMIAMLQSGFNNGALNYDPNTLYTIFTAGAVNLGGGFGGTSFRYCAYHTHGTVTVNGVAKTVLYAAMPYDAQYPSSCTGGAAPNGDVGADAEVNTLAHEIEETTTDMMGNAWYDSRGYENADKCAWQFGPLTGGGSIVVGQKNFLVQMNWVNAGSGGCIQTYP